MVANAHELMEVHLSAGRTAISAPNAVHAGLLNTLMLASTAVGGEAGEEAGQDR